MIRAVSLAALLALGACTHADTVGESWSQYYPPPYAETGVTVVERLKILTFTTDPSQRELIGYLEKCEARLEGTRFPREFHYLVDKRGTERLGFVTERGEFFRFNKDGTRKRLGHYPLEDVGLRVFYGLSTDHVVRLDSIDPYRD